jgi:hypothetical protein
MELSITVSGCNHPKTHLLRPMQPEYKSGSENKQTAYWILDLMPSPLSPSTSMKAANQ